HGRHGHADALLRGVRRHGREERDRPPQEEGRPGAGRMSGAGYEHHVVDQLHVLDVHDLHHLVDRTGADHLHQLDVVLLHELHLVHQLHVLDVHELHLHHLVDGTGADHLHQLDVVLLHELHLVHQLHLLDVHELHLHHLVDGTGADH